MREKEAKTTSPNPEEIRQWNFLPENCSAAQHGAVRRSRAQRVFEVAEISEKAVLLSPRAEASTNSADKSCNPFWAGRRLRPFCEKTRASVLSMQHSQHCPSA